MVSSRDLFMHSHPCFASTKFSKQLLLMLCRYEKPLNKEKKS